jgi:hypothetical protein
MMRFLPVILFLLFYSCNPFAPEMVDLEPEQTPEFINQKTPEGVLESFRFAYVFKDSLLYSDLLDSSFLFISKNYTTSPPSNWIWGKDVDIKTTIGMFRHFNILELTWGTRTGPIYNQDSTESKLRVNFQLILHEGSRTIAIMGEALYDFIKRTDTNWRITRWEDLSSF